MSWEEEFPDDEMMMDKGKSVSSPSLEEKKAIGEADSSKAKQKEEEERRVPQNATKQESGPTGGPADAETSFEKPMDETTENKSGTINLEQPAANLSKELDSKEDKPQTAAVQDSTPGQAKIEKKEAEAPSTGLGKDTKSATEIQEEAPKGNVFSMWGKIRESLSSDSNHAASHSADVVNEVETRLGDELQQLLKDITRVGEAGKPEVTFGELFDDEEVEQYYEALVGTLKSAKKRGLIDFKGQMLLKGPNDKVVISIVQN